VQLLTPINPNSSVNQKFFREIFRQRWEQHGLNFMRPINWLSETFDVRQRKEFLDLQKNFPLRKFHWRFDQAT
jgi:hypothetical protein